jgi:hypothetical protein
MTFREKEGQKCLTPQGVSRHGLPGATSTGGRIGATSRQVGNDRRHGFYPPKSVAGVSKLNHTVKLSEDLQKRIDKVMRAEGYTVWADFCRAALNEKCRRDELRMKEQEEDVP